MGTFDYITYQGQEYQTKDTPAQFLDKYKIDVDQCSGHLYLWYEAYTAKWVKDDDSFFGSRIEQSNHRWECCHNFDGKIDFYRQDKEHDVWIEFHSLFMNGKLLKIEKIDNND